jgi:phage/conjugal plasmid C-4 type zinc finger TraR family protein
MQSEERSIEASELLDAQMRELRIAVIRASLVPAIGDDCTDCGEDIEAARRVALPSAVRCVRCQERFERRGKA